MKYLVVSIILIISCTSVSKVTKPDFDAPQKINAFETQLVVALIDSATQEFIKDQKKYQLIINSEGMTSAMLRAIKNSENPFGEKTDSKKKIVVLDPEVYTSIFSKRGAEAHIFERVKYDTIVKGIPGQIAPMLSIPNKFYYVIILSAPIITSENKAYIRLDFRRNPQDGEGRSYELSFDTLGNFNELKAFFLYID